MSGLSVEQILYGDNYKYEEKEEENESEVKSGTVPEVKNRIDVDDIIEKFKKYYKESKNNYDEDDEDDEDDEEIQEKIEEENSKWFRRRTHYNLFKLSETLKFDYKNKNNLIEGFKKCNKPNIANICLFKKFPLKQICGNITGFALKVAHVPNLACVDVDIKDKHNLDEAELKKISDELFEDIRRAGFSHVDKTPSGGAHIWCNVNNFKLHGLEQQIKFASNDKCEFDLFAHDRKITNHCNHYIMLYGSIVKCDYRGLRRCEMIIGSPDKPVTTSLEEVLNWFKIMDQEITYINRRTKKETNVYQSKESISDSTKKLNKYNSKLTKELLDIILKGYTVENFGQSEVIHAHTMDNMKIRPANINLISAIKSIELLNDDLQPNEQFDIDDILQYFSYSRVLTTRAREFLITDYGRYNGDEDKDNWMKLVYILKYHANKYYVEHLEKVLMSKNAKFLNSNVNFNYIRQNIDHFESIQHFINTYSQCLASVYGGDYYVARVFDAESKKLVLVKYTEEELLKRFKRYVYIKTTEEEREKMKSQKKKVIEWKEIKGKELMLRCYKKLPSFVNGYLTYTSSKDILSLYQPPPVTKYEPELIMNWLEFVKSLVVPSYHRALYELFASVSWKLRYPDEFVEKFFVQYGKGLDGKSYLVKCISKIFDPFYDCAVDYAQLVNDPFNKWVTENLFIWLEEVQGNRQNIDVLLFSKLVKTLTTEEASNRGMFSETKKSRHIAIIGFNTNQSDLKGLTRADWATQSRLVIIKYQENNMEKYGGKHKFGEKCRSFIRNPNFVYSLYYYFMNEFEIPKDFDVTRYDGKEKEEFIVESNKTHKSVLEEFVSDVIFVDKKQKDKETYDVFDEYEQNKIFIEYESGNNQKREPVIRIKPINLRRAYNQWKTENPEFKNVCIFRELEKENFVENTIKGNRFYVTLRSNFEQLLNRVRIEDLEFE